MIKRILTTLPALLFTFNSYAFVLPTHHLYTGFEVGIGNKTLEYNNSYNLTGSAYPTTVNYTTPFKYSVNSSFFTGGIMLGYLQSVNPCFALGYELLGMGNSGSIDSTDNMQSPFTYTPAALQEYTVKTSLHLPYGIDLAVKPMLELSQELVAYIKAGVANAKLTSSTSLTKNNALTDEVFNASSGNTHKNIWGYVLGAGLEFALSTRCSLFGEYNFHQYQQTTLKTIVINDSGSGALPGETVSNTIHYSRKVSPYINSFNIGLHYYF